MEYRYGRGGLDGRRDASAFDPSADGCLKGSHSPPFRRVPCPPRCFIAYTSRGRSRCPQRPALVTSGNLVNICGQKTQVITANMLFVRLRSLFSRVTGQLFLHKRFCCWPLRRARQETLVTYMHVWKLVGTQHEDDISRLMTGVKNGSVSLTCIHAHAYVSRSVRCVNQLVRRTHN